MLLKLLTVFHLPHQISIKHYESIYEYHTGTKDLLLNVLISIRFPQQFSKKSIHNFYEHKIQINKRSRLID